MTFVGVADAFFLLPELSIGKTSISTATCLKKGTTEIGVTGTLVFARNSIEASSTIGIKTPA